MIYADYDYYKNEFGGSVLPESSFVRAVKIASQYMDMFTFNRITEEDMVDAIRDCTCDMAETAYRIMLKKDENNTIKSESNDGYSVTYVTEQADGQDKNLLLKDKLYHICKVYLLHTGLMCCEVERGC